MHRLLAPGSTPSVIACGDATFPKGTAFGGGDKVSGIAIRRPLGGAGERSEPEGVLGLTACTRLQKSNFTPVKFL